MNRAAGIVLCGGQSSRMGRPKAWLPFGDETLLQRVVRLVAEVVNPVVVVAAPNQSVPELPSEVLVTRDQSEYLGPLSGLATGLAALDGKADFVFLTSCDVPFLRSDFVRRVLDRLGDASVCLPKFGGYRHPLAAAYRVNVLPLVNELIAAGRMRPVFISEVAPTVVLHECDFADVDPDCESLRNLNTPEEYTEALQSITATR